MIYVYSAKEHDHINPRFFSGNYLALDLIICDPIVYVDFSWDVKDYTYESDHFRIRPENFKSNSKNIPYWKLNKANWNKFKNLYKENLMKNSKIVSAKCFIRIAQAKECVMAHR